ncbi:MAG TPA: M14 metallopeptidase family protein [Pyrinomonadaceae bacterium]|nr:M14 metallopeptidase family protein [Pyrinomonadaceae bacterium]
MTKNKSFFAPLRLCALILFVSFAAFAAFAQSIPAPKDVLGFTPGDDKKLASWKQVVDYFQKLDRASDRVNFEEIGKSTNGNPFVYATISTPANLKNLEKYKQINAKLADPRLIKSNQKLANDLIRQGKTIVLITCGIHSSEVGSYLSSMLIADKLARATDAETLKILDNTIILLVPSLNPDGVDIIKNWYDKTLGTPFEGTQPPELYHKYVGHDNNRDWYAFTQVETQLTVDKIHNIWHPQIVHDIHQQGATGARLFLPPYLPPVEPNVPKELIEGFTELGSFMANDLRGKGFSGITTGSTYDAWTPARAYSHYHGGVRILSETASARLATPVNIKYEDLRSGLGYDVRKESANFSPVWKGGEWHLRDITNYMTTAAFSLLKHASDNRERWLSRFYTVGKEAVRPRKDGELFAYILPMPQSEEQSLKRSRLFGVLSRSGVELGFVNPASIKTNEFQKYIKSVTSPLTPKKDWDRFAVVIPVSQPYGNFVKAMLEKQEYPNLRDASGTPIQPYDVTAHTLPLLFGVESIPIYQSFNINYTTPKNYIEFSKTNPQGEKFAIYRSHIPTMDEGWTRWIFEKSNFWQVKPNGATIQNQEILGGNLDSKYKTIIFPDQSANQILNGFPKGAMPDEYTGGIGKDGAANLKKFVEAGGTLVFFNRASNFAIEQFDLPVRDVTQGLARKDFFIPGSILRTELDTSSPIAKGMPQQSIAWFENSPAFEITDNKRAKIIAKYPLDAKSVLLSGYALGAEKIVGKAALVEIPMGKGKIILFGFRPQYRGQSLATFPLLFNAISN